MSKKIVDSYEAVITELYNDIKLKIEKLKLDAHVRREKPFLKGIAANIIEVWAPHLSEYDDYGIVIDIQIKILDSKLFCEVDMLKTNGPIYSHNVFEIQNSDEEFLKCSSFTESVTCIKNLSNSLITIYIESYQERKQV
jgi:hypothetical protein